MWNNGIARMSREQVASSVFGTRDHVATVKRFDVNNAFKPQVTRLRVEQPSWVAGSSGSLQGLGRFGFLGDAQKSPIASLDFAQNTSAVNEFTSGTDINPYGNWPGLAASDLANINQALQDTGSSYVQSMLPHLNALANAVGTIQHCGGYPGDNQCCDFKCRADAHNAAYKAALTSLKNALVGFANAYVQNPTYSSSYVPPYVPPATTGSPYSLPPSGVTPVQQSGGVVNLNPQASTLAPASTGPSTLTIALAGVGGLAALALLYFVVKK